MITDIEQARANVLLLTIVLLILVIMAFIAREYRLRKASDFDIEYEHYKMREQHEYLYCPYCGEYLGDLERKDDKG